MYKTCVGIVSDVSALNLGCSYVCLPFREFEPCFFAFPYGHMGMRTIKPWWAGPGMPPWKNTQMPKPKTPREGVALSDILYMYEIQALKGAR